MKKTIRDYDLKDKKVIIRVDFNVPIKDGIITDDNRIVQSLETINYALEKGAKVILMSHLGRIKTEEDLEKNSLKIVSTRLEQLLKRNVLFIPVTKGEKLENAVRNLKSGQVLLMENTRFEDLYGKKESSNDEQLGKYWSSLGDVFINDAFGTCHRAHASNVGIASYLPNGIGFLIEKELLALEKVNNPDRPLTVIIGGSKVSDKIGLIQNLVKKCDHVLIGGAMAFTFLKAKGFNIGKSLLDVESIDFCTSILNNYPNVLVPVDSIQTNEISEKAITNVTVNIDDDKIGIDIGPKTIKQFKQILNSSKTIIWNGPVGMFEYPNFSNGTKEICSILSRLNAFTIVGGGDTASAVKNFGFANQMNHVSTGGGATLEFLEGKNLPGIEIIEDK